MERPAPRGGGGPQRERIPELDGLRAIAISLVAAFHYVAPRVTTSSRLLNVFQRLTSVGWAGVDLFFVLSGFLIGGILLDAKSSPRYFRTFYARRVFRILPLYYSWVGITLALPFLLGGALASSFGFRHVGWVEALALVFFLQNAFTRTPGLLSAWLGPLWSLAVEEQFYLLAPWLIRWLRRGQLVKLLLTVIILAPLLRLSISLLLPKYPGLPYRLTACRADALAMGVLLAVLWRDGNWMGQILARRTILYGLLALLSLGIAYLMEFSSSETALQTRVWGYCCVDLFFATLLLLTLTSGGGVWARICRLPLLRRLGRISYCAYIIHVAVLVVCHKLLRAPFAGITSWYSLGATLLAAAVTWGIAELSWHFLESRLLRLGHAYRY